MTEKSPEQQEHSDAPKIPEGMVNVALARELITRAASLINLYTRNDYLPRLSNPDVQQPLQERSDEIDKFNDIYNNNRCFVFSPDTSYVSEEVIKDLAGYIQRASDLNRDIVHAYNSDPAPREKKTGGDVADEKEATNVAAAWERVHAPLDLSLLAELMGLPVVSGRELGKEDLEKFMHIYPNAMSVYERIGNTYRRMGRGYDEAARMRLSEDLTRLVGLLYDESVDETAFETTTDVVAKSSTNENELFEADSGFVSAIETQASPEHPDVNQDTFLKDDAHLVYGVFDGVGGYQGGDRASLIARDMIKNECEKMRPGMSLAQTRGFLRDALLRANEEILNERWVSAERGEDNYMATTATVCVVWKGENGERKLVVGNVGDSRVSLYHDGVLEHVTIDDNMLRDTLIRENGGNVERAEKRLREFQKILSNIENVKEIQTLSGVSANDRNLLEVVFLSRNEVSQILGRSGVEPRVWDVDFPENANVVLESDGLGDNLTDSKKESILQKTEGVEQRAQALKKAAWEMSADTTHGRSKPDDITVMVVGGT